MVREERPSVDGPGPLLREARYPADEVRPIAVVPENGAALQATHHDMVQGLRGIQAGLAGHDDRRVSTTYFSWQRISPDYCVSGSYSALAPPGTSLPQELAKPGNFA